jgi:hypothetical protein
MVQLTSNNFDIALAHNHLYHLFIVEFFQEYFKSQVFLEELYYK